MAQTAAGLPYVAKQSGQGRKRRAGYVRAYPDRTGCNKQSESRPNGHWCFSPCGTGKLRLRPAVKRIEKERAWRAGGRGTGTGSGGTTRRSHRIGYATSQSHDLTKRRESKSLCRDVRSMEPTTVKELVGLYDPNSTDGKPNGRRDGNLVFNRLATSQPDSTGDLWRQIAQ